MKHTEVVGVAMHVAEQQIEAVKVLASAGAAIKLMGDLAEAHRQQSNLLAGQAMQKFSKAMSELFATDPDRSPDYLANVAVRLGIDLSAIRKGMMQ